MNQVDLCQIAQERPKATQEMLEQVLTKMTKEELITYAEKLKQMYISADEKANAQENRIRQITREARTEQERGKEQLRSLVARTDYLVKGIEQLNRSAQLIKGEL